MDYKKTSKAVCVLGMHRSGTSALAGTLNLLGIELGNRLGNANQFNPKGYWEHLGFVQTHQKILNTLSSSWDAVNPLPQDWWNLPAISNFKQDLIRIITNDFGIKPLWGWKDPRTCILIPLWKEILASLSIDPYYIIAVRNPLEVAASLQKRNNFTQQKSFQLWYLYTLTALKWTANSKRILIHYDNFLSDWESQLKRIFETFKLPWPHDNLNLRNSVENFVKPTLRHTNSNFRDLTNTPDFSEDAILLYKALLVADQVDPLLESDSFNENIDTLFDKMEKTPPILYTAPLPSNPVPYITASSQTRSYSRYGSQSYSSYKQTHTPQPNYFFNKKADA